MLSLPWQSDNRFYAYLLNKGCSRQPESLPDTATSNVCKLDSMHWGSFMKSRLMEYLVTRFSEKKMCINLYTLPKRSIAMLSWNVLTTSRQLLVTQLRFRYMFLSASWEHLDSFVTPHDYFWTCSTNFQKFLVLPTVQESSRSVKKCQELVTEVTKKYQDINFGTLLVQIRIVGQGP